MTKCMISAPQPEAVEAGLDIFKAGGNVMDAAIGAAMVQTVVDPQMCGIAGFGAMQIMMPEKCVRQFFVVNGREPLWTSRELWAPLIERECDDGFGFVLKGRVNEFGYTSMTSPMTLRAFDQALSTHGTMPLGAVMQPAIRYCFDGFAVRPRVHAFWMQPAQSGRMERVAVVNKLPAARKIYLDDNNRLLNVGDILKNPDMGRTYQRIADEGIEVFYSGDIAELIEADMAAHGGLLTKQDLAACLPTTQPPLVGSYRGIEVATNQLPGGGLMILEMLNILECFDLAAMGHNSASYIATVAEAMKLATIDKDRKMGDPNFVDVPVADLSSKAYARALADRIRAGEKAVVERVNSGAPESKDTTHLVVADSDGNIVNVTHSLGSSSGVITDGLGFMYNNCMMVFDPRPGHIGSLAPGKARFTAMCPTILSHKGAPMLALGAPGGTTITMGVLQAILNVVDFGMTAHEAVCAPRFCATSNRIELTNRIFRSVEADLNHSGYETIRYAASYVTPLVHAVRLVDGQLDGGADPAGDGMAAAV
ncbi:MAG: gamma-glutamyltransferase family protein [Candidatus Puniceispirillum sp.]